MPVNSRQIELAKLNLSVVIIYFGLFIVQFSYVSMLTGSR